MNKPKIYSMLHEKEIMTALNGGKPTLTTKQFLGKEEGQSYFKPADFIQFAKSLRPQEVEQLEQILSAMQEGLRIVGSLAKRTDKGGRTYVYLNTNRTNATIGAKLILEEGTNIFLKDYMDGKFVVGFTLEELVEEALAQ